jgi:hypothetical protein
MRRTPSHDRRSCGRAVVVRPIGRAVVVIVRSSCSRLAVAVDMRSSCGRRRHAVAVRSPCGRRRQAAVLVVRSSSSSIGGLRRRGRRRRRRRRRAVPPGPLGHMGQGYGSYRPIWSHMGPCICKDLMNKCMFMRIYIYIYICIFWRRTHHWDCFN